MTSIPNVPQDYKDLLQLLSVHSVDYVIVGGQAVGRHGYPRLTVDLDVLIYRDEKNAQRLLNALADFGFTFENLTVEDFLKPGIIVQLGIAPVRIDLLTSIEGVSIEEVFAKKITDDWGDFPVHFIGLDELLQNKKAVARPQDLADAAFLESGI